MSSTIEFTCPHCDHVIRGQARHIGKRGKCPNCGQSVTVQGDPGEVSTAHIDRPPTKAVTTDVSGPLSGLIATVATVVLYALIFFPIKSTYIGELFTNRGPIPFIITFVTCWGLAILVWKYVSVKQQLSYAELELELIPLDMGMQVTPDNAEKFLKHLDGLPAKARESILGRRIHGALEHFRSRNSVPEVQSYLASRAELDASSVDSGYTLLRAFIWAVPILGFIGTVMGISGAVGKLAESLDTARVADVEATAPAQPGGAPDAGAPEGAAPSAGQQDEDGSLGAQMIQAMGGVTQGLAIAFDTTFLALIMAILLLFPTEALRKIEYAMLDRIETFTNDSLLRRMSDDSDHEALSPEVAKALEPAFQEHQRWLVKWQSQVAELGDVIGRDFDSHITRIEKRIENLGVAKADDAQRVAAFLSTTAQDVTNSMERWTQASNGIADNLRSVMESAVTLQELLGENTRNVAQLMTEWPRHMTDLSSNLEKALETLNENVGQLNKLVSDGKPAALPELVAVPRRGGIFRFWRKT